LRVIYIRDGDALVNYMGYDIREEGNGVVVENVRDFDPVHMLECGQCFRWNRQNDGSYTGVAFGRAINISFQRGRLVISNTTLDDFKKVWFEYFDLGRDYAEIKKAVCRDEIMEKAIEFGSGIRLLKQDIWEVLISFIISANNMIPRIMKTIEAISGLFGDEIRLDNRTHYSFPGADRLSESGLERLNLCGGGFRCRYIILASRMIKDGAVRLEGLKETGTSSARDTLMKLPGVGPKVADCILLYSATKFDVFPTDVWVKRVMEELYFKRRATFGEIQSFAADYFNGHAGFAQQYLFYYARANRIGRDGR